MDTATIRNIDYCKYFHKTVTMAESQAVEAVKDASDSATSDSATDVSESESESESEVSESDAVADASDASADTDAKGRKAVAARDVFAAMVASGMNKRETCKTMGYKVPPPSDDDSEDSEAEVPPPPPKKPRNAI